MTTPNIEELMALADRYATLRIGEGTANARKELQYALQSQAERIKVLERESEMRRIALHEAMLEADTLRAQLAEIEKIEPVAWIDEYGNAFPLAARQYSIVGKGWKPLFTRPLPSQDVTELVEALEEYGRAGVGNSTDWRVQLSALRLATAALSKYKGAK